MLSKKIGRLAIISVFLLTITCSTPVWAQHANHHGQSNEANTAIGIGGQVIAGGAMTYGGILNSAIGIGGQVIGGNSNYIQGVGAIAGGGIGNSAGGIGGQVIGGSEQQLMGIGAVAGAGNYNTAVGIGVQVIGSSEYPVTSGILDGQSYYANAAVGYGSQLYAGNYDQAIGCGAQAGYGDGNTAVGAGSGAGLGDGNTAVGTGAYATGYYNTAVGTGATATGGSSVAIGAGSVADRPNSVSVGSPGYERQVTNVAPGTAPTDAVNVSQLRSIGSRIDRVGASAFALSALAPLPYDPDNPTQYSVGLGTYNGEYAMAFGVYHYTKKDVLINAAFAISDDGWEKSGRFGVTWRVGSSKKAKQVAAKTVIIPSIDNKKS